jgi:hypothetical protein
MLLAGGSALATVLVLGSQTAYALIATTEDLAALAAMPALPALDDPAEAMPLASASSVPVIWAAAYAASGNRGKVAAAVGSTTGQYQELAAVDGIEPALDREAAPQPSYNQLAFLGEPESAEKLAQSHAVAKAAPAADEPDPIGVTPRAQRVRGFEELAAIDSAELDNMRGGFDVGGITVRFGFEIVNTLNSVVVDKFTMPLTNLGIDPVNITHTQTSQDGSASTVTTLASLTPLAGGWLLNRTDLNGGKTAMAFSFKNGVLSLIQNSANSQKIQSQANIGLNVSGLTSTLRAGLINARIFDTIRNGLRNHH